MATVTTKVVIRLDDQFSEPVKQAVQNYKNSLSGVQKKAKETENIFESISKQLIEASKLNEKLAHAASVEIDKNMVDFENGFSEKSGFEKIESIATFAPFAIALKEVTIALAAFYATWKTAQTLEGLEIAGRPMEEPIDDIKDSLEQLSNMEALALPPIPQETVRSLEITKSYLEQIQAMQDIFITVNLVDNATEEAKRIREEIAATFSKDITQRVRIIEETVGITSSFGGSDSIFSDSPLELQTPSLDLTGFGPSVTNNFASGIDRVPRDMLAMIHKDEAVLPKNRAEDFRRGGSSGMTIQNLNFSFNVPNGLKLDREEFRNLAFQMRDELNRLDQRIN